MLSLYQRSGRLSTEINPTVEILDNNRINLVYKISESEITEVSKIIIIGNKNFSTSNYFNSLRAGSIFPSSILNILSAKSEILGS